MPTLRRLSYGPSSLLGGSEPVPNAPYPTMVMVVPAAGKPACPGCNVSRCAGIMFVTGCVSESTAMSLTGFTQPLLGLLPLRGLPGSPTASCLNDTPARLMG